MNNWDKRFLELAEHVATWSKDPRTKVGSVIVDDKKRVISLGYNGFPRGVYDEESRYTHPDLKHLFVAHAERNALDNAPYSVAGCTLYTTLKPCSECAKSIIQNGIKKVVCYQSDRSGASFNWHYTDIMFDEAGIQILECPTISTGV